MLKRGLLLAGLLVLGACSQAPVSQGEATNLQTQRISTADDDSMVDVAVHRGSGAIYALSNTNGYGDSGEFVGSDAFLRRYNRNGTVAWTRQIGPDNSASARALTTDSSGNVLVSYNDQIEKRRGDGSLVWSRTVQNVSALGSDGNGNVYISSDDNTGTLFLLSKYTAAGSRTWTRSVGGRGIGFLPTGIATDLSGNVYVAVTDVDDCCLWSRLLKYSPSGQQLINKEIGASGGDVELRDVVVSGNALYLAGNLHANWDFSEDVPDRVDGLLVKMSLGGTEGWRRVFGTPEYDDVNDLSTDANGGVYVTGFASGNLGGVQPRGNDAFLRKYNSSGQALWTKQIGSAGDDDGNAVVAYSSSEIYLGGEVGGALLGGTYRGGQDGFLRRTDGSGNRVWTDQ